MIARALYHYMFVCVRLRILDLEENYLESIPNEVGRLRQLTRLILQSNALTQLPRAIGNREEDAMATCRLKETLFVVLKVTKILLSLKVPKSYKGFLTHHAHSS